MARPKGKIYPAMLRARMTRAQLDQIERVAAGDGLKAAELVRRVMLHYCERAEARQLAAARPSENGGVAPAE